MRVAMALTGVPASPQLTGRSWRKRNTRASLPNPLTDRRTSITVSEFACLVQSSPK